MSLLQGTFLRDAEHSPQLYDYLQERTSCLNSYQQISEEQLLVTQLAHVCMMIHAHALNHGCIHWIYGGFEWDYCIL